MRRAECCPAFAFSIYYCFFSFHTDFFLFSLFSLNKLALKNGTGSSERSGSMETNQSSLIQELSY